MHKKHYLKLFISTFYLSAFTFGGGYVIVSLMKKKFVDNLKWIEEEEMLNLIAIAQASPGAVAVNASILIGYRIGGTLGAFIAILGTVLPPLIIISIVSVFYASFRNNEIISRALKAMQPAVAAIIFDVVINMGKNTVEQKKSMAIFIGAFIANYIFKINVIYIIVTCVVLGIFQRNEKEERA